MLRDIIRITYSWYSRIIDTTSVIGSTSVPYICICNKFDVREISFSSLKLFRQLSSWFASSCSERVVLKIKKKKHRLHTHAKVTFCQIEIIPEKLRNKYKKDAQINETRYNALGDTIWQPLLLPKAWTPTNFRSRMSQARETRLRSHVRNCVIFSELTSKLPLYMMFHSSGQMRLPSQLASCVSEANLPFFKENVLVFYLQAPLIMPCPRLDRIGNSSTVPRQ